MNVIELDHFTKCYGPVRAVRDLTLHVPEGAFYGFIGPNGAGKSTTIRAILGLLRPTSGRVSVLGRDVSRERTRILAETGYLASEAAFWPGETVGDLLDYSARLRGRRRDQYTEELLQRLQLDPSRKVDQLSYGNRKKTAAVAALQHRPRLLVLDEPTGGMDPLIQREFFAILEERRQAGATIFLSSHIMPEIRRHCDRAAVISRGRLAAEDRLDQLAGADGKQVTVQGHVSVSHLPGVRGLQETPTGQTFLYHGDPGPLLQALAQGNVRDCTITEPDLEDWIQRFYREEGDPDGLRRTAS